MGIRKHLENLALNYDDLIKIEKGIKRYNKNKLEIMSKQIKNSKPKHYQKNTINGLDVIDMIKIFNLNFNEGNILKYLLRKKNQDIEDLKKVIDYATRELNHLKELKKDTQNQQNEEKNLHGW